VTPAVIGWALAAAALLAGWLGYGWRGLVLALSVIAFWLLLQFSRTLRLLRNAAQSPLGHVDSAVMLNARLSAGLRLPDVIGMTRSLGRKVSDEPEVFAWRDGGGDEVEATFEGGRCTRWQLRRQGAAAVTAGDAASP
jgi:Flp pilus assembly protein TadB